RRGAGAGRRGGGGAGPGRPRGKPARGGRQVGQQRAQLAQRLGGVRLADALVQLAELQPALGEGVVQPADHHLALGVPGAQAVRPRQVLAHGADHTGGHPPPPPPADPPLPPPRPPGGPGRVGGGGGGGRARESGGAPQGPPPKRTRGSGPPPVAAEISQITKVTRLTVTQAATAWPPVSRWARSRRSCWRR